MKKFIGDALSWIAAVALLCGVSLTLRYGSTTVAGIFGLAIVLLLITIRLLTTETTGKVNRGFFRRTWTNYSRKDRS
jgi:hypothetical protein